jgi:DNA modification methylase
VKVSLNEKYLKNMNAKDYFQRDSQFLLNTVNEGDGLELLKSLKSEVVQLVIFDPQYRSAKETTDRNYHFGGAPPNSEQDDRQIKEFCYRIFRVLKQGGYLLLWINQGILLNGRYRTWLPSDLITKTVLIWIKGNKTQLLRSLGMTNVHFVRSEEYCLVIRKNPFESPYIKKRISNIFNHFEQNSTNRKVHNVHVKPYKMIKAVIKQLTNKGDLVIDPCAGSFVSLIACQKLKRDFLGTDLTLRKLMKFNINKENSRALLRKG